MQSLLSGMLANNGSINNGSIHNGSSSSANSGPSTAWPSTPALSRRDFEELESGIAGATLQRNVPCTRAELILPLRLYGPVR